MSEPALSQARNLAGRLYWDESVFAAEMEGLFSRTWLYVARVEDLETPGDFLTREIGPDSVLLVRGQDGIARAFYNVCRHRGTRLLGDACGEGLEHIVCPYHSWVYSADGTLTAAPDMDTTASFRREDFGLIGVRLEEWQGFLFVNLDSEAASLTSEVADFPDISGYGLERLRRGGRRVYEVEANWKILCENYSECYHCARVHPHLHRLSDDSGGRAPQEGVCFNGGPMGLKPGFDSMTMTGKTRRAPLAGLDEEACRRVEYYTLYPNLLLSLHPDYVLTHSVMPMEPGRSQVVCELLFAAEERASSDFDPNDALEFWDLTNRQDWQLCENVQRGVRSRGHRRGPYQAQEDCVYYFDRWYLRQMDESTG